MAFESDPLAPGLRRTLAKVTACLALLAVLAGCKKSEQSTTVASAPPKVVRLGYFANLTHAQAVLGVESGDFARAVAPSEFQTKVFNAGPSLMEALAANAIDVGYVGPGPALASHSVSHGEAVRVICGVAANGVAIVARKGSGITSIRDIAGKKIATPQHGNTQDIAARHYVTAVLGQKNHDNVIAVQNAEQAALMQRGEIDVAWVPEPWGARLMADAGATLVAEEKDLWPKGEFSLTVIVTTPEFLKAHPDVIDKLLGVHRQWTRKLRDNPTGQLPALGDALAKLTGKRLPADVVQSAIARVRFTDDPMPATFETMGQWAFDLKFAQRPLTQLDVLFAMPKAAAAAATQPSSKP
jgi:NitT/TauT family transport system substrate-binding protein